MLADPCERREPMRVQFRCKRCGRDIDANFTRPGKTAQCVGCHFTQEIPDPSAGAAGGGGGGGGGEAPAPPEPAVPPGRPAAPRKGGGGVSVMTIIKLAILAIAAFAAYKFGKGRFF
jgi:hypothetical protein